ncbi:chain length determinant protein [Streptomyces sp. NPDC046385]|uniref:chain length determinant protein n=1 Tax=unclassified Streptomyces TaxID=2593676 RepID=UPI0033FBC30B
MDLAEIFRVMCRRWYVLVPGLLLTAGLTVGAWFSVPTSYESQSTVALLNSRKGAAADGNPFLSMEPSLTGMADSLARNVNSDVSVSELKGKGLTEKYEAKIADNAQGPLLWLTVTGDDPDSVLTANKTLMAYTAQRLKELQADQKVEPDSMIRLTTIVPPQDPQAQLKSKVQYLIMAAGLGFVLSLVATFFVEARRRHGAPAKHRQTEAAETPRSTEPTGPAGSSGQSGPSGLSGPSAPEESAGPGPLVDPEVSAGRPAAQPLDQPTMQLPVQSAAEHRPAKRPPSWVK